jgi:serine/threonine protein phosphatase PrpC
MRFEQIGALSLPGNPQKPNEDSYGVRPHAACVFDGATGLGELLMPGKSDAQWIANFAARRFCAHAEAGQGGIRDWLRLAAEDAKRSFTALRRRPPRENYEIPYASAVMIALDGHLLHILWFGDCALMLRGPDGGFTFIGDTLSKRESERARVEKISRSVKNRPADVIVRDEFLPALRASRNLANTGDDWVFAPDPACAEHAKSANFEIAGGAVLLLASDGFLALASDYRRYSPDELLSTVQQNGLQQIADELRAIEMADPAGIKYPRFKTSDDATALLLRTIA